MIKKKLFSIMFFVVTLQFTFSRNAYAYLDPGTGSYIFQVMVAAVIGALFTIKMHWQKIKNSITNLFSRNQKK